MDELQMRRRSAVVLSFYALIISGLTLPSFSQDVEVLQTAGLPTVTVRGFLNFRTTVDGTVIVFTPAAELPKTVENIQQTTKPIVQPVLSTNLIHQNEGLESKEVDPVRMQQLDYSQPVSVDESIHSGVADLAHLGHKVKAPFLQHLSDNVVLPSTIQTDNDLETSSSRKGSSSYNRYPTGLVTVLDGTHVEAGKTTIFETKVIGTYIDGKYAQILHSTSKIIVPTTFFTPSYESVSGTSELTIDTFDKQDFSSSLLLKTTEKITSTLITKLPSQTVTSPSTTISMTDTVSSTPSTSSQTIVIPSTSTKSPTSPTATVTPMPTSSSKSNAPSVEKKTQDRSSQITSSSPFLQSSFQTTAFTTPYKLGESTQSLETVKTPSFKTSSSSTTSMSWIRRTPDEDTMNVKSTSMRLSSIRTRFSAPRRPSQSVKLNRFKVKLTLRQNTTDGEMTTPSEDETTDHDEDTEDEETHLGTTEDDMLDVDPAHVVYQETTITSKVTLHVGRRKSIRTLTITTSVPMRISPTEDGEVTMTADDSKREHETVEENAPATYSVVSRTFTTTERTFTTSVVPVFDGTLTAYHTLTESLFIMKIVTAYKTLPPTDFTVLPTTHTHDTDDATDDVTSLDVAANVQPSVVEIPSPEQTSTSATVDMVQPSVPVVTIPNNNAINNPILSFGQALSNNPLAAVYLGLQQLNAQMTLYSTVTQTSTYVTTDTVFSTKVIRVYDGRSTRFRTMSDPVSTKERTVTTTITKVQPYINTQAYQQQQQLQKLIAATQLPIPQQQTQQFSTLTTIYTTATTATSLSTRIYTLIYNGFSTKFRTVTSTKTYPTVLTVTSTKEVPIITAQPQLLPFAYPYPAA